jgi:hypothetical protein
LTNALWAERQRRFEWKRQFIDLLRGAIGRVVMIARS